MCVCKSEGRVGRVEGIEDWMERARASEVNQVDLKVGESIRTTFSPGSA
jgi:hypothetical protein